MVQKYKSTKTQWPLPCGNSHQQHALKGQKLLEKGNTMGITAISSTP